MENLKRFSLLRVIGRTIAYSWKMLDQWRMYLFYAGLLTILSLIFGRWSFSCVQGAKAWCHSFSGNIWKGVGYLFLFYSALFVIFFLFGYDLYNSTFKNTVFKIKNLFVCDKNRLKSILFSVACLLAFIVPVFAAVMIVLKPANPVFEVEFLYFIILFACVIFNVLYIRLASFIARYLNDYKMPSLGAIYEKTKGRAYVSVVSFLILAFFLCLAQLQFIGNFIQMNANDTFVMTLVTEFLDYIIKLIYFSFFLALFRAQMDLLAEEDASVAEIASEEQKMAAESVSEKETRPAKKKTASKAQKKTTSRKKAGRVKS